MPAETLPNEPCYLRSERSPAFAQYCERVYGRMLNQYGAADMEQLDLLLGVLHLQPDSPVLDVGCGTGETTSYLAERTGAKFIGVDKAARSIAHAQQIALERPGQLTFKVGSLDNLDLAPSSFDAVISIDSLYFCKNMSATMAQFRRVLRPAGQMAFLYTHVVASPEESLLPEDTKVAAALRESGFPFNAYDLSESDRRFWLRAREVGEDLREELKAEGNGDLARLEETAGVLEAVRKGCHARYLYHCLAS